MSCAEKRKRSKEQSWNRNLGVKDLMADLKNELDQMEDLDKNSRQIKMAIDAPDKFDEHYDTTIKLIKNNK